MTEPLTLTHDQWLDAETILAPAFTTTPPPAALHAGYDPQILRALTLLDAALHREPDPARDALTARRMAVILLDPGNGATPYRCDRCARAYRADPDPADWAVAGTEDWVCWECAVTPQPGTAPLAIEAPAKAARPRKPRAKPAAAKGAGGGQPAAGKSV